MKYVDLTMSGVPNSLETAVRIHSFEYWLWSLNYRTWVQISDPTTKNFNHHSYQALNQTIASEIHQLNCKLRQIKIIAVYFRKTGNERNESKIEFSSMLENFIPSAVYLFPPLTLPKTTPQNSQVSWALYNFHPSPLYPLPSAREPTILNLFTELDNFCTDDYNRKKLWILVYGFFCGFRLKLNK